MSNLVAHCLSEWSTTAPPHLPSTYHVFIDFHRIKTAGIFAAYE